MSKVDGVDVQVEKLEKSGELVPLPCGKEAHVLVCKTRHIPLVLRLIGQFVEPLQIKLSTVLKSGDLLAAMDDVSVILDLLANQYQPFVEVLSAMSGLSEEEIGDLDVDDLLVLSDAVWRINKDFFTKRVGPILAAKMPVLVAFVSQKMATLPTL